MGSFVTVHEVVSNWYYVYNNAELNFGVPINNLTVERHMKALNESIDIWLHLLPNETISGPKRTEIMS